MGFVDVDSRKFLFAIMSLILLMQCSAFLPVQARNQSLIDSQDNVGGPKATDSQSPAWLSGWDFRKSHTIGASAGAGTSYQVRITVHDASGTDSGENVYCSSRCQSDFDDVRFTSDDGMTELHYWRQEYSQGLVSVFWVEIQANLSAGSSDIFVYYGNDAVGTTSNGSSTFPLFDDFEGAAGLSPDTSRWSIIPGVDGVLLDGNGNVKFEDAPYDNRGDLKGLPGFGPYDYSVMSRARSNAQMTANQVWHSFWNYGGDAISCWPGYSTGNLDYVSGNNYSETETIVYVDLTQWHVYEAKWLTGHAYWYVDDGLTAHHTTNIPDEACWVSIGEGTGRPGTYTLVDWIAVRECTLTEPTHLGWSAEEASSGWLLGWSFRKAHSIDGLAGAGTNYQIRITTHYGLGTDSGGDVYCDYSSQPDFDDVRFTDDDGVTLLDYWMEDMVQSDYASIWVEVADNLDSSVRIYLYYGNAAATSASNGDATFIFFDDFESGVLNPAKWQNPADWQIVGTNVKDGSYAAYCVALAPNLTMMSNFTGRNLGSSFMLHVWARFGGLSGSAGYPSIFRDTDGKNVYSILVYDGYYSYNIGGGVTQWPANSSVSTNTYYRTELGVDFQNNKQRAWRSGSYMGDIDFRDAAGGNVTGISWYGPSSGYHPGEDVWIDDCYIRKWIPNEPQHAAWGVIDITNGTTSPHITDGTASIFTFELLLWFFYSVTIVSIPVFLLIQSKRS